MVDHKGFNGLVEGTHGVLTVHGLGTWECNTCLVRALATHATPLRDAGF